MKLFTELEKILVYQWAPMMPTTMGFEQLEDYYTHQMAQWSSG